MEIKPRARVSRSDRIAVSVVRSIFIVATLGMLIAMSFRGQWEAQLNTSNAGAFIENLPVSAIWKPPAAPDYKYFTEIFNSLPNEQPDDSEIVIVFQWDRLLLELLFWLWLVGSFTSLLYIMAGRARVDRTLHFVFHVSAGLTFGAFLSVALWLLFGGWGPPAPLFFAILGLTIGLVVGANRLQNTDVATNAT